MTDVVIVGDPDHPDERGEAIATAPDGWVLVQYPDGDKCWTPPRSVRRYGPGPTSLKRGRPTK